MLMCSLSLAACNSSSPPPPVDYRTKPPFEPPNRTQTATFDHTATAEILATQAMQTEQAQATLNVQSTAMASARMDAITAYAVFDPFDQNDLDWREGVDDNAYWQGDITLQDGVYAWQVNTANQIFLAWSFFTPDENLGDFDLALKARRVEGPANEACYGLLFRTSPDGYQDGTYVLSVCDEGYFKLLYFNSELGWENIQDWTQSEAIFRDDWNLLEISARGDDFSIFINHQPVTTFTDNRLASGLAAILIDIYGVEPSLVEFDFFALQTH